MKDLNGLNQLCLAEESVVLMLNMYANETRSRNVCCKSWRTCVSVRHKQILIILLIKIVDLRIGVGGGAASSTKIQGLFSK